LKETPFAHSCHFDADLNAIKVCESGWIEILTTQTVPLSVDIDVDFSGPSLAVTALSAALANAQTYQFIEIYVQCTNTFCLIPVSKIAQAVADQFVTQFDTAVKQSIASVAAAHPLSTTLYLQIGSGGGALQAALAGTWTLTPGNAIEANENCDRTNEISNKMTLCPSGR
jgi:hypothetical protein